jgi:heat-inducible transcriptional repressor
MRVLKPETQENRKRKLLQAVIYQFVRTAKPVGSQVIVDKYNFGLSSATVRNLLVDLEKEGFLVQPHTSAGRIPTDKGYRFYVDSLLEIQTLAAVEEDRIRKEYSARSKELEDMMISTSHMLSAMSHYTGIVLSPRLDNTLLRRLQLIPLGETQILVVVVSQTGHIRHRVVQLKRAIPNDRLSAISNMLNDRLKGLPLSEVRTQILDHIEAAEQEHTETLSLAKDLVREAFDLGRSDQELYVDGKENIIDFPDFNDFNQLSTLLRVVEEKNLLTSIMEKEMKRGGGLTVKIGSENKRPELHGVSLVSSTYKMGENAVGVLGILGPRRMEYARMIALVEGVTRIVNQMLTRFEKDSE